MQGPVWAALVRQIPPEVHNQLMLVTGAGIEIAIQSILRIEADFLVLKARLAGSQDGGRVYFIPSDRIDYIGFLREVKDSEFETMFGDMQVPAAAPVVAAVPAPPAPPAPPVIEGPVARPSSSLSLPSVTPGGAPGSGVRTPIKSDVLERFRQRSVTHNGTTLRPPSDG